MTCGSELISSPDSNTYRAYNQAILHANDLQNHNQRKQSKGKENTNPHYEETFARKLLNQQYKELKPESLDWTEYPETKRKLEEAYSEIQDTDIESIIDGVLLDTDETKEYRFKQYVQRDNAPFVASERGIGMMSDETLQGGDKNREDVNQVTRGIKQEPAFKTQQQESQDKNRAVKKKIAQFTQEQQIHIKRANLDQAIRPLSQVI